MSDKEGAVFTAQLYDVRTKRDGGGRIALDFGADGLIEVQWLQQIASIKGCNFQVALVPLPQGVIHSGGGEEYMPDENGEIPI